MTTNIYDACARKLASDSRWSINRPNFVIFVDDTGFDKIFTKNNFAMMFAGNGMLIQIWKNWLSVDNPDLSRIPSVQMGTEAVVLCMVNMNDASILFEYGQQICLKDVRFAGSGSEHAHACWSQNRDPCLAIESAKKVDLLTGGEVKFFDFMNSKDNLQNIITIDDVHQKLKNRGRVMYKLNPSKTFSVQDAANSDLDVKALLSDVTAGKISAGAPCDSMHNQWSKEKINELHSVLHEMFSESNHTV